MYLHEIELVLKPEPLLTGEAQVELPQHRDSRGPEHEQLSDVPGDVLGEEVDHLVEDVDHVVDVDLEIARLATVVEQDVVEKGDVLDDEVVRQVLGE